MNHVRKFLESLQFYLLSIFLAYDVECCKKECPCAFVDNQPQQTSTDFEMFMKLFKNAGDVEYQKESMTPELNSQDEENLDDAMKQVLEIIDNQILSS